MGFISTLFAGLLSGWLAKIIMPGKQKAGLLKTTLLGIVGAFLANFIFGGNNLGNFSLKGLALSTLGAIGVLFVYGLIQKRK